MKQEIVVVEWDDANTLDWVDEKDIDKLSHPMKMYNLGFILRNDEKRIVLADCFFPTIISSEEKCGTIHNCFRGILVIPKYNVVKITRVGDFDFGEKHHGNIK